MNSSTARPVLYQTDLRALGPVKRGKVRDIYDLGDRLLIVACDRLSAFDVVLPTGIPDKGKILNQLTNHWFEQTTEVIDNHLVATDLADFPPEVRDQLDQLDQLAGRSAVVRKAKVIPVECVARGYLAGSAFLEYQKTGVTCGHTLSPGLVRASKLPEPIFTPSTKEEQGHDLPLTFGQTVDRIGAEMAGKLRDLTLALYTLGVEAVAERGLILADTKFEFGLVDGEIVLIDEVLTPDSSRYWEAAEWTPGVEPVSYDKQYVRNWLDGMGWDRSSPAPTLPDEVVEGTRMRYVEAFRKITGSEPELAPENVPGRPVLRPSPT